MIGGKYTWTTTKNIEIWGFGTNVSKNITVKGLILKMEAEFGMPIIRTQSNIREDRYPPGVGILTPFYFNADVELYIPLYKFKKAK